jgi:MoxR-like ATPase
VLTYEALSDGLTADQLIQRIVQKVPAPEKPLAHHVAQAAANA